MRFSKQVLTAGRRVFVTRRLADVTKTEILKKAGLATNATGYYVPDLEGFAVAVCDLLVSDLNSRLGAIDVRHNYLHDPVNDVFVLLTRMSTGRGSKRWWEDGRAAANLIDSQGDVCQAALLFFATLENWVAERFSLLERGDGRAKRAGREVADGLTDLYRAGYSRKRFCAKVEQLSEVVHVKWIELMASGEPPGTPSHSFFVLR